MLAQSATHHTTGYPAPVSLLDVFGHQPLERFASGTAIFWQGDSATSVFEIVEGVLRTFKILSNGRRVITGFLFPGDIAGVSLQQRYLYGAEAIGPVKLRRFGRARFESEIERAPGLRSQLLAKLCEEMAAAQDQMVLLACKSAEERVASFLLSIARRNGPARGCMAIELPMTRLDMADFLGLTIETVSRVMTRLAARGVITARGRRGVVINSADHLALLAGDDDPPDNSVPGSSGQRAWSH